MSRSFMPMVGARFTYLTAILALCAHIGSALASGDECEAATDDCVKEGGWNFSVALGAGDRTNPLAHSKDIPLVVIPQFSYYGHRIFIDDLDLGFTLADGPAGQFNLVASPGYDRVYFYRSDVQNFFISGFPGGPLSIEKPGTPESNTKTPPAGDNNSSGPIEVTSRPRRVTYLAGPEWTFKYLSVSAQVDFLHEITEQNHGNEIRAALGVPLGHVFGAWSANVGLTWKSSAIVNYYYGEPGLYQAGAALDPFIRIGYTRPLSRKWKLTAFMDYERLANAIADSPIVAHHFVTTAFIGASYEFHK